MMFILNFGGFLKEKKFLLSICFFVALSDDLIEKQLFNAFKILNLNFDDFLKFFNENKSHKIGE
jgi:hypothetical protein